MSKIQKLPEKILDEITPYLLTGEVIDKALLQDNKKPREIWLIKTNQAIILHGTQPDKPQPAIMVMALDEIPEIDYLQKIDDIQVILYSSKNNGKAVFHFETSASKEIEKFLEDLGDLITYRYQNAKGKITVVQKALPIGSKERKVFGRGKPQEVPFISKSKNIKQNEEKPATKPAVKSEEKIAVKTASKIETKTNDNKAVEPLSTKIKKEDSKADAVKVSEQPVVKKEIKVSEKVESKPLAQNVSETKKEIKAETKAKAETKPAATAKSSIISHLQENPVPKTEQPKEDKPKKEIDFGNPVYFITVTVIATIVGFFCLSFFKMISKIVTYFKRH